jgi:uncharacterized protein (TIGR04255 family)
MPTNSQPTGDQVDVLHSDAAPFPETPRVVYQRNPLAEVICQLRFPPVLRIEAELPAAFQDRIRQRLPIYRGDESAGVLGGIAVPDEVMQVVRSSFPGVLQKQPRAFSSADEKWTVTLAKDFLALATSDYSRWENFRGHLDAAVQALEQVYEPAFYSRIGLRYRDVIRRSALGLETQGWQELLRHHLAGEVIAPEVSAFIEKTTCQTLIRLQNFDSRVQIRHGLLESQGESCYVIDSDFFTQNRTERSDVFATLQYFNTQAHRLFRWCISERLHEAMGPQPIS